MDVDGVISLFGFQSTLALPGAFHTIDGIPHCIGHDSGGRVKRLHEAFEMVWATGWEEKANEYLPLLLDLPERDYHVLSFDGRATWGSAHWKLDAIDEYAGSRPIPHELLPYRGWEGKQTENRYSHWVWRQYASAFWDDVRLDRVLPYRESRDEEDEKHVHPLQLDVIDRCLALWSNPGERVLTPFMGVGSEVYAAVLAGRLGIGVELKPSYYRQAVKTLGSIEAHEVAAGSQLSIEDDLVPGEAA